MHKLKSETHYLNINLMNENNIDINIASFKGKTILIDFWAS